MLTPLLILGAGGTAADVIDAVAEVNRVRPTYECAGLLDDDPEKAGQAVAGVPVLGPLARAREWPQARLVNALGSPASFRRRAEVIARTGVPLERFATIVHPRACVSPASTIGAGVVVYPGAVICSRVVVGDHVTILANTVLNHDVWIGAFSIAASGVNVSGAVRVGESCYLGVGSAIVQRVTIGEGALVGAGAVVIRDVPAHSVVVGNPARLLAPRAGAANDAQPRPAGLG